MVNQKNNKVVILLLIVIIVILSALCVLFATGTISLKSNGVDNNDSEQNITENDIDKTDDNIINKLTGSYTYKGEYVDKDENYNVGDDALKTGKTAYEKLKLNESGYAEASAGNVRAGGYSAKGKWYISNNELIIVNEQCKAVVMNDEVVYPNCHAIWTYALKEENGTIVLISNNNSMTTVTLNKVNN